MSSQAFRRALGATGFFMPDGTPARGLVSAGDADLGRLRPILKNDRIGLNADAVFSTHNTPVAIFKDSGDKEPLVGEIRRWHEAAWNFGVAPLLWIITPTEVRLYDCFAAPISDAAADRPLDSFAIAAEDRLHTLDAMCGRLATETGAFWSSPVGAKIDRRHRVDRELLAEINALEEQLTALKSESRRIDSLRETRSARDFAQRLIGRCIFTWYLLDRGIAQRFFPSTLPHDLTKIFAKPATAFKLFAWLRSTFNGDLFPMDDPGAEQQRLTDGHLALIRDFVSGKSLVPESRGQGRLFRFRFDAIPVDLVSSIYQQFARSSAEDEARLQGLHYTPVELVHLALDPVFEGLAANARVLDPTCGSGAFLVEAFRRLVWKNASGRAATRALVRRILYKQLFGIDINRAALGITAFSLYLAALEFDDEAISKISDLKFDRLIGTTLFEADTISDDLPASLLERPFDAVVGNPPWTFDSARSAPRRRRQDSDTARPRRSPDQAFLGVASRFAGTDGRIGMVMKASPFFSRDEHAVASRNMLLRKLAPVAIVNLSALRKEELFPDATGPALLFFARCALMPDTQQIVVGSVPWTPDFRRNGVFHIGPAELHAIPLKRVLRTPAFLKAATFGTSRDGWLIEKLEHEFPTLNDLLSKAGIESKKRRGQGFQVEGDRNPPPSRFFDLRVLTPDRYTPFRPNVRQLEVFSHKTLHRPREEAIYRGPLLICPKASFKASAELGRYSATVSRGDLLYNESFYGISFANRNARWAYALNAILNSSLTTFQLAFGGGTWGLERSTVEPKDLLSIRVPDLSGVDPEIMDRLLQAEKAAAEDCDNADLLEKMDAAVFDLYSLERDEALMAHESVMRARILIFEGREQRRAFIKPPSTNLLTSYALTAVQVVDDYLKAKGRRHLEATVYDKPVFRSNWAEGAPGLTAVRFTMATGASDKAGPVWRTEGLELEQLAQLLRTRLNAELPPYLNERRQLRIYLQDDLFILKPSEARYWTRTAGLNDADTILADHWLGTRHAARA